MNVVWHTIYAMRSNTVSMEKVLLVAYAEKAMYMILTLAVAQVSIKY